jgi:hypothetical protein
MYLFHWLVGLHALFFSHPSQPSPFLEQILLVVVMQNFIIYESPLSFSAFSLIKKNTQVAVVNLCLE